MVHFNKRSFLWNKRGSASTLIIWSVGIFDMLCFNRFYKIEEKWDTGNVDIIIYFCYSSSPSFPFLLEWKKEKKVNRDLVQVHLWQSFSIFSCPWLWGVRHLLLLTVAWASQIISVINTLSFNGQIYRCFYTESSVIPVNCYQSMELTERLHAPRSRVDNSVDPWPRSV